ncbi:MAG TPA: hypothetical protein H9956_03890 [Candidatus Eisenbergiella pullicola]|nr:hypothetical protein [Candidatus Eisenbergiella pullicola]
MRKERGSITLEAAIFLSLFLMGYLAFLSLIQVGRAQMIMQYTLNETAKELSQSSYILTKTGIVGQSIQTGKKSQEFQGRTQELLDSVMDFGGSVAGNGDVLQSAEVAYDNIEDYFSNSDDIVQGLIAVIKNTAGGMAKEWAVSQVCRGSLKKQLEYLTSEDSDVYLAKLGIQGGIDNISFEGTTWFDTSRELDIVMTYRIQYDFGVLGKQDRVFKVRAKTAIW